MSNVLHKITKVYLKSVNTPDFSTDEYLINPILPECDKKFWIIEGDTIREMTQVEKDAHLYLHESTVYLIAEKQLLENVDGADYETNPNAIINPVMPNCDLKYTKAVTGEVVEMTELEQDAVDLADAIPAKQDEIKTECTEHILAAYPESIQRSASMGLYSLDVVDSMKAFIAGCIIEENRCFDALGVATTLNEVEMVVATFPEA